MSEPDDQLRERLTREEVERVLTWYDDAANNHLPTAFEDSEQDDALQARLRAFVAGVSADG